MLQCDTRRHLVLRLVDDVPVVGNVDSNHCKDFTRTYKAVCEKLNIQLADDCPLNDKAFSCQKRGKVLGVMFDSTDLSWRMSDNKISKAKLAVKKAMSIDSCTLKEWQKLMGRLNDISQMCPFMKCFRQPINRCVLNIPSDAAPLTPVQISEGARKDLQIWANFLCSEFSWLPISKELSAPPTWRKEFVSAGLSEVVDRARMRKRRVQRGWFHSVCSSADLATPVHRARQGRV
jgi:hypothetical protein